MRSELQSGSRHLEQSLFLEWAAIEHQGEILIVRDVPEGSVACYRVRGLTRNVRAIATVDAVIYEGRVLEPFYDEETRRFRLQHDYAGLMERLSPEEWLEDPLVCLDRCDRVALEDVLSGG